MPITSPRATERGFPIAPLRWSMDSLEEWVREVTAVVNGLMDGQHNATGTITLTVSSATSTLADRRIGRNTKVVLVATTANAAAAVGGLSQTFPNAALGAAVLNHANDANADKSFAYVLQG